MPNKKPPGKLACGAAPSRAGGGGGAARHGGSGCARHGVGRHSGAGLPTASGAGDGAGGGAGNGCGSGAPRPLKISIPGRRDCRRGTRRGALGLPSSLRRSLPGKRRTFLRRASSLSLRLSLRALRCLGRFRDTNCTCGLPALPSSSATRLPLRLPLRLPGPLRLPLPGPLRLPLRPRDVPRGLSRQLRQGLSSLSDLSPGDSTDPTETDLPRPPTA